MSEFKETKIGLIPQDWKAIKFEEILKIPLRNGLNKPSYLRGDGYKMVNMNEIFAHDIIKSIPMELVPLTEKEKETSLLKKNDLLFARQSLVFEGAGKCSIFLDESNEVCFESHLIRARLNEDSSNPLFYYYFFISNTGKRFVRTIIEQSVVAGIRGSDLKELVIPYPPKLQQDKVAALLSSLDKKIDNLRRQNKTLEKIAQLLFERWFIDFEFPNDEGEAYKSSGGAMVSSELGDVPHSWRVGKLGDIANISIGRTPPRKEKEWFSHNSNDIKWISIKDMGNSGVYIFDTSEYLTQDAVDIFNIPVIFKNTVIISFKLTIGRTCITSENMLSNEAIAHLNFKKGNQNLTEYIYLFLKQFNFSRLGSTSSIATAVNSQSIKQLELIIPDKLLIDKFNQTVAYLFKKILVNTQQIQTLTKTRDLLLPKLMSGEIRLERGEEKT